MAWRQTPSLSQGEALPLEQVRARAIARRQEAQVIQLTTRRLKTSLLCETRDNPFLDNRKLLPFRHLAVFETNEQTAVYLSQWAPWGHIPGAGELSLCGHRFCAHRRVVQRGS